MSDGSVGSPAGIEPYSLPFRVGEWLAEPAWNRISRDGESVKLEPRVMRLLATLSAAPGRPLLRQELLDSVWPGVFVNEEALSRAVSQLRRALGDNPKAPRYLQTVHKGGYCMIAPVADAAQAEASAPAAESKSSRQWPAALLLLLCAAIAGILIYLSFSPSAPPAPRKALIPLTSDPGREIDPAVSPDGTRVAYLASSGDSYEIFVRSMSGGAPVRLTRERLTKGHPSWSPAGDRIAFVGADGDAAAIYTLSVQGGAPEKLLDLPGWSFGLDWSPDGRMLAYSEAAPGEAPGIVLLNISTKAARPIAKSANSAGDVKPVFSPDGKQVAFIRNNALDYQRIAVADLRGGGEAQMLAVPPQQLRGLDWAPDGESIIFSGRSGRRFGLWRLPLDGSGHPQAVDAEGGELFNPSISREGRIVVEEVEQDRDIWRTALAATHSEPVIRSTADDFNPVYEPSGSRIAFVSERSGTPEIWIQSPAGEARRLTSLSQSGIRSLTWSGDGTKLAFVGEDESTSSVYAIEAAGGEPVRLFESRQGQVPIGWTAAGDALYILSPAGSYWRLNAFDLSGRGMRNEFVPALRAAALAFDGRTVFAVPAGENKLVYIVPGQGLVRQFRLPPLSGRLALLPSREAVFIVEDALGTANVRRLDLKSGAVTTLIELESYSGGTVSLSPDARSIVYSRARETGNDLAWIQL